MERELSYSQMVEKKISLLQQIRSEQTTIKILALKAERINVSTELNKINEAMINAYERIEKLDQELIPITVKLEEAKRGNYYGITR